MKKSELVDKIAEENGITKAQADGAIKTLVDCITSTLVNGDRVSLKDLGGFSVSERKARTGLNPRTGEKIEIRASKTAKFSVSKALKEALN